MAATTPSSDDRRPRGEDGVFLDWKPGDLILDLYEVTGVLGEGGMGRVYKVHHRGWNQDLAVKCPRPQILERAGGAEFFEREAETWVNLGLHPHIAPCYYVRRLGGIPRIFVAYVAGGSLADWVRSGRLYEGGRDRALARLLDVAIQFAWGLHYAHERGLVHQDVKPDNVLMSAEGTALVTDFGLARSRPQAHDSGGTLSGYADVTGAAGTRTYQSPEQAAGRRLTHHTDVWSWAISVVDLFAGAVHRGFGVVAPMLFEQFLKEGPGEDRRPRMPDELAALLRQCFQPEPNDRIKSLAEAAEVLRVLYGRATGGDYPRDRPEAAELLADSLNNQAVSLFDLGKQTEAEAKWQEALRVDPHHPEATYNGGLIRWRSARLTDELLLRQLREVRASCSNAARMDYLMGLVHLERDDCETTIEILGKAGGEDSRRVEIASALARAKAQATQSTGLIRTLKGHTNGAGSVAWSPDGRFALSGGDKILRLWEASSGRCLRTFEGHTGGVISVAWSPDGRFAISGGSDKTVRLWEASSGKCLRTFEGHTNGVFSVSWSPDSRFALSGSLDTTLRLWEVSSGRCLRTFEGHARLVWSVAWSPDGRFALSGGDKTVRLWEASSGRCLRTFEERIEGGGMISVAWSPDGRFALSGGDKTVRLWEASSGRCLRTFEGHTGGVISVAWSPDGRHALSGSQDRTVRLWEASSGRCLRTFEGHADFVWSVAWSPDGRFALSGGGRDPTVRLWRVGSSRASMPLATSALSAPDHPAYRRLFTEARQAFARGEAGAAVDLLAQARRQPGCTRRADALALARRLSRCMAHRAFAGGWESQVFSGHSDFVLSVAWSPDGRFALSSSWDQTVCLWEASSGRCLRTFGWIPGRVSSVASSPGRVNSVAWSPDGRFALGGALFGSVCLWEASSGRCLRTFDGHTSQVESVAWSPDGRFAISGGSDKTVRLWEASSGRCLRTFEGQTEGVNSVACSPDGRFIIVGGDKIVRLWEASSGRCLRTFEGHTGGVNSVAWSPDGRFALSAGGSDKTVRLWEASSGKCLRTFEGHTNGILSVSWSPDGRHLLSGSQDWTLRLWEASSGRCLRTFEGHTMAVQSVAWSPDGRFALSGSWDNTLRLWELDWELERNQPADWHEGATAYLEAFLSIHAPYAALLPEDRPPTEEEITAALSRQGKPSWTEDDFRLLLDRLGCAGYGWLRPEGVRRQLEQMAAAWQGPRH